MVTIERDTEVRRGVSRKVTCDLHRKTLASLRCWLSESLPQDVVLKRKESRKAGHSSRSKSYRHQSSPSLCAGRAAWLNRELQLELGKLYNLWKKQQTTQEDCKGLMKLLREQIRRTKVQLEFSLLLPENTKRYVHKYINNKRKAKETLHPLLGLQ